MASPHVFSSAPHTRFGMCPHTASQHCLSVHQLWDSMALRQHAISVSKQLQTRAISIVSRKANCQGGGLRAGRSEEVVNSSTFRALQRSRTLLQAHVTRDFVSDEEIGSRGAGDALAGFGNVIDILENRGLVDSITGEGLRAACSRPETAPLKVYVWFDPSAESLHLGNLLGIVVLSWFQRCGHVPVAVVGGATGLFGDPSGKRSERPTLGEEAVRRNSRGIQELISRLLSGDGHMAQTRAGLRTPLVLDNYDWWKDMSILDFLRDVGKYARVGTMLAKDSVREHLQSEEGMSFTEFTYQLIQGYDFVYLFKEKGVSVQIGGSDQWANITAGTDLVRRLLPQENGAHGLTHPLLLKSDGSKFGKSDGSAVWLAPSLLSSYMFYQHLFATQDSDVINFLKMLTFLSLEEIADIEASMGRLDYLPNAAQSKLAEEVTRFVHGHKGLREAVNATRALAPGGSSRLDAIALEAVTTDVPCSSMLREAVLGMSVVDLCTSSGLLASKGAARRLIKQGGLYLNNVKVEEEGKTVEDSDLVDAKLLLLGAGKKKKLLVRVVNSV